MQRASLDFWVNYLETMLFYKHTVKQCLVSIISQIQNLVPAAVGQVDSDQLLRGV